MEKRKLDNRWRYVYAIFIAVFLFFLGFLISYSLNLFELNRVSNLQEDIYYDFYKTKILYDYFDIESCNAKYLSDLGSSLDFQGSMITSFEEKLGKENFRVLERKKFYFLLELSHYSFMKGIQDKCGFNNKFILFFYSNQGSDADYSINLGRLLSHAKSRDNSILIYSFDYNSEDVLVSALKLKYKINQPGQFVINEEKVDEKIYDLNTLNKYLN